MVEALRYGIAVRHGAESVGVLHGRLHGEHLVTPHGRVTEYERVQIEGLTYRHAPADRSTVLRLSAADVPSAQNQKPAPSLAELELARRCPHAADAFPVLDVSNLFFRVSEYRRRHDLADQRDGHVSGVAARRHDVDVLAVGSDHFFDEIAVVQVGHESVVIALALACSLKCQSSVSLSGVVSGIDSGMRRSRYVSNRAKR